MLIKRCEDIYNRDMRKEELRDEYFIALPNILVLTLYTVPLVDLYSNEYSIFTSL